MNILAKLALSTGLGALVLGCGSSDSNDPLPDGAVQVVNAILDAPILQIDFELDDDTTVSFGGIGFKAASPVSSLASDDYLMTVQYTDPDQNALANLLSDIDIEIDPNIIHTVILAGSFAVPEVIILEKDAAIFSVGDEEQIEVQILNLSDATAAVYLGPDNEVISSATLLGNVTSGSNTDAVLLGEVDDDDEYRLRLTNDGSDELIYDSGEFSIPVRARRTIVVTESIGPDPDVRNAFLLTETGTVEFPNEVARAGVRIVNAVADELTTDIQVTIPSTLEVVEDVTLSFPDATEFVPVEPSFVNIAVEFSSAPGSTTNSTVSLDEDTFFTIVVGGSVLDEEISIRASTTTLRPVATQASLQFVNTLRTTGITDFDRVDLYALPIGDALADAAPTFGQVEYLGGASGSLDATTFDLVVTTAGTQSILAGPIRINVQGSTSLLVLATEAAGGGLPNQIIVNATELD